MNGITLDTGALIALERKNRRMIAIIEAAFRLGLPVTVPTPVLTEWWRGQRGPAARLLEAFHVEAYDKKLAKNAGEALAIAGSKPSTTDAAVMASAARRGDRVYTGDIEDLQRLQRVFSSVRLFRV